MVDYKLIGSRIKETRENVGMTQEYVAEKADITVVYLSKIENGKVHPTLEVLNNICITIGCDFGSILLNIASESDKYQNERVVKLFNSCSPSVKPIALELLGKLSEIK